jgi:hypothetical protein
MCHLIPLSSYFPSVVTDQVIFHQYFCHRIPLPINFSLSYFFFVSSAILFHFHQMSYFSINVTVILLHYRSIFASYLHISVFCNRVHYQSVHQLVTFSTNFCLPNCHKDVCYAILTSTLLNGSYFFFLY